MNKFITVFTCLVAIANAGFAPLPYAIGEPTITSQHQNILRSPGNLAQISTYSKTVDTPFSSSSKSDVRVSNPGVYSSLSYAPAAVHYSAPASYVAAAPAVHYAAAPAPAVHYAASAPAVHYAASAPVVHAAPAVASAPIVAHATFSAPAFSYAW